MHARGLGDAFTPCTLKLPPEDLRKLADLLDQVVDKADAEREAWFAALDEDGARLAPTLRQVLAGGSGPESADLANYASDAAERHHYAAGDEVGHYRLLHGSAPAAWAQCGSPSAATAHISGGSPSSCRMRARVADWPRALPASATSWRAWSIRTSRGCTTRASTGTARPSSRSNTSRASPINCR